MGYSLIADTVLAVHVALVGYVFFGQLVIWLGLALRSLWVRNSWFRWTHLILIVVVGIEAVLNIECPLTRWEREYRLLAGQAVNSEPFLGRLLHNLLYVNWPLWVLNSLQLCFALLALATFVLAPPHHGEVVPTATKRGRVRP